MELRERLKIVFFFGEVDRALKTCSFRQAIRSSYSWFYYQIMTFEQFICRSSFCRAHLKYSLRWIVGCQFLFKHSSFLYFLSLSYGVRQRHHQFKHFNFAYYKQHHSLWMKFFSCDHFSVFVVFCVLSAADTAVVPSRLCSLFIYLFFVFYSALTTFTFGLFVCCCCCLF